jgi:hypothetical protein
MWEARRMNGGVSRKPNCPRRMTKEKQMGIILNRIALGANQADDVVRISSNSLSYG